MAYDSARDRTVMFGGKERGNRAFADTWEWDGKNWAQIKPAISPPARNFHAMVYDSARKRTVLFGGYVMNTNRHFSDTWEWDGKNWAKSYPLTKPPVRFRHAMAYDSARKRTVLFGGFTTSGETADTWEWDGKNWTRSKLTASPPARFGHAMAYDPARGHTVMFGGLAQGIFADTWVWNGKSWTQIKPAVSPPARVNHAMAYDSARGRTLMFGGSGSPSLLADTWEWDGKNWTRSKPAASPSVRSFHAMAYDSARDRTVLFGGASLAGFLADTWEYYRAFPASFSSFGSGCKGSAGVPLLTALQPPIHAKTFTMMLSPVPTGPSNTPFMLVGASNTNWAAIKLPLDLGLLGAPGCKLLVSADVLVQLKGSGGTARFDLAIPGRDPWLLGKSLYLQGLVMDSKANPLGIALSNAGKATIGNR